METLAIRDKKFRIYIESEEIQAAIARIAQKMDVDLKNMDVVFVPVLNGAFMFAADLFRRITLNFQISFLKLSSYEGTKSTGKVRQLIGLNEELKNKTVVILEDIVDSGNTLDTIIRLMKNFEPASIKIATLLFKPDAYLFDHKLDYVGFQVQNDFVAGYGLDYNGYGRNLESIYKLIDS
jgi:hypoxanthine phosphoribosyltransferase